MKRVYLFCSAGMSTSMLASKMQGIANSHDLPIEVEAFPDGKIGQIIDEKHPDVILLGPQVRFQMETVKKQVACPVTSIDPVSYGTMNGKKVLNQVKKELGEA